MRPIKRSYAGAGSYVVPLNRYGKVGASYFASANVTVSGLADSEDPASIIATLGPGTGGSIDYPADALLVVTTGAADITVIQYSDAT